MNSEDLSMQSTETNIARAPKNTAKLKEKPENHIPGEAGIWLFIAGDIIVFSLMFCVFFYERNANLAAFQEAQYFLNETFGAINTFLMLTSSWFVASAVRSARLNSGRATPILLLGALSCGFLFLISKAFEWGEKIQAGITLTSNDFFTLYYMYTGIHALHVVAGMGILLFLIINTWQGPRDATEMRNLESGSSFWHLVDMLWLVLFPLFYLIR